MFNGKKTKWEYQLLVNDLDYAFIIFFFFFFFLQFTMNQSKFEEFLHVAPLIKKTTEKTEPIGACERLPTSLLDYR